MTEEEIALRELCKDYEKSCRYLSFFPHPNRGGKEGKYPITQKMFDAGKPIVPIILEKFAEGKYSSHYFPILQYITGVDPLPATPITDKEGNQVGNLVKIDVKSTAEAWVAWGKKEGLI